MDTKTLNFACHDQLYKSYRLPESCSIMYPSSMRDATLLASMSKGKKHTYEAHIYECLV